MKRWAPRLALSKRLKVIRKWPISLVFLKGCCQRSICPPPKQFRKHLRRHHKEFGFRNHPPITSGPVSSRRRNFRPKRSLFPRFFFPTILRSTRVRIFLNPQLFLSGFINFTPSTRSVFKSNSPVHTHPMVSGFTLVSRAPLH